MNNNIKLYNIIIVMRLLISKLIRFFNNDITPLSGRESSPVGLCP